MLVRNRFFQLFFLTLTAAVAPGGSSSASAAPTDFKGSYAFKNRLELMVAVKNETVYTLTADGKARLQQLQGMGYECVLTLSSTWKCRKFLLDATLPTSIEARLMKQHSGKLALKYGNKTGSPQLINDSPELKEWILLQSVEFNGKRYSNFRYLEAQRTQKLAFGDTSSANTGAWLRIGSDGLPRYFESPRENGIDYLVELVLED